MIAFMQTRGYGIRLEHRDIGKDAASQKISNIRTGENGNCLFQGW